MRFSILQIDALENMNEPKHTHQSVPEETIILV